VSHPGGSSRAPGRRCSRPWRTAHAQSAASASSFRCRSQRRPSLCCRMTTMDGSRGAQACGEKLYKMSRPPPATVPPRDRPPPDPFLFIHHHHRLLLLPCAATLRDRAEILQEREEGKWGTGEERVVAAASRVSRGSHPFTHSCETGKGHLVLAGSGGVAHRTAVSRRSPRLYELERGGRNDM
jgi:hypothetical protein